MSEQPPKTAPVPPPDAPPRLERVAPPGGRPGGAAPVRPTPRPDGSGPRTAPGSSHGLGAREVTAAAALAAGLVHGGSLAEDGALRLFYLAAATHASGRLTVGTPPHAFALTFRRGTVEHAASADPEDALARHLLRRGAVTPEGLARALAAGGDLVGALIGLGLLAPADAAARLQEHGAALVGRALALEAGPWRWEPGVAPPPSSFPLGAPWAMLCSAVRAFDPAAVERRLGARTARAASRVGGRIRVEDLRLTPQESRVVSAFDGRSVAELAHAHPAEAATLLRLALLLGETELLAFGAARTPPAAPRPPAAAGQPAPAPAPEAPPATHVQAPPAHSPAAPPARATHPAGPPATARPAAAHAAPRPTPPPAAAPTPPPALDRAALEARYARMAKADHFEVLGVKRDAALTQIKVAYFKLAKLYHPDTVPPAAPPEVKQLCADVFSKVSEAWGVLGDDAKRAEYLQALATGGTEQVDVARIFEAEAAFQQGTLLVKARRYAEGRERFVEAAKLNPDEAEFGMWQTWCDFLLAEDKRRQHGQSAAAIEDGLRRNPRCAQGYLFLGQMAKITGDAALAEKHLRRGLAVAPEHAELQRELKYLRK